MKTLSEFKRGDTFTLACTYKVDDQPATTLGKTITSQIRKVNGVLISQMTVTVDNVDDSKFTLTPVVSTTTWPIDVLLCDIQIVDNGFVRSSETLKIPVVEDITR
jgi:hypothetical protein